MNLKPFLVVIAIGCIFAECRIRTNAANSRESDGADDQSITLEAETDTWMINRTSGTSVASGTLSVGSTVTVKCASPDAHKNEVPGTGGTPTPADQ